MSPRLSDDRGDDTSNTCYDSYGHVASSPMASSKHFHIFPGTKVPHDLLPCYALFRLESTTTAWRSWELWQDVVTGHFASFW